MIVLGIETATTDMSLALADDDIVLSSYSVARSHRHVEALHLGVLAMCSGAGIDVRAIDAIAVDKGPGLFTGLRVGVVAAKTLAIALNVPLVAPNVFAVLRFACDDAEDLVVPTVDMRRGEIGFVIRAETTRNDTIEIGTPEVLSRALMSLSSPVDVVLIGDGAIRYQEQLTSSFSSSDGHLSIDIGVPAPSADALVLLAGQLLSTRDTVDPVALVPLYLRGPDAKANFATRNVIDGDRSELASLHQLPSGQLYR